MLSMGSILIRKVPDVVHRKFKQACRARKVSMEEAIVRLLAREVGEGRRGRPRASGAKRRTAAAKSAAKKTGKKPGRTTARGARSASAARSRKSRKA
jgi:hypothetical protein